jgi:hypothetical protein
MTKSYLHLMKVADARAYVTDQTAFETFKTYIFIEETRPYDELTDDNTYIPVEDLRKHMTFEMFMEMICNKTSIFQETRWTVEVKQFIHSL